jgi:hypothetical protein
MPAARAAGYKGSARNLRRAVAKVKAEWRQKRRIFRPWVPSPGQHLVVDWTSVAVGLHMFCAVLAWSHTVSCFASDESDLVVVEPQGRAAAGLLERQPTRMLPPAWQGWVELPATLHMRKPSPL